MAPRSAAEPITFELPDSLAAPEPPEARGLSRDDVRLMTVSRRTGLVSHTRLRMLPALLRAGDCLVCNASRTLPASLRATVDGHGIVLRLARRLDPGSYSVLLLDDTETPWQPPANGMTMELGDDLSALVIGRDDDNPRLWRIRFSREGPGLMEALSRLGQPVRYWYVSKRWDLDYYQTVYAREPGSMEMPSAGRAFTWRLLTELRRKGVELAFVVLHAGLSSLMDPAVDAVRPPGEEPFSISTEAAEKINAARASGGRVVAVGTTVVRALESAVGSHGRVGARESATRLHIDAEHRLRVVDGLITGFHEPASSHLDLLSAFISKDRLAAAYDEALRARYFWHEFGDLALIL